MLAALVVVFLAQDSPFPLSEGNEWVYQETWKDTWPRQTATDKQGYQAELQAYAKAAAANPQSPQYPTRPYLPPQGKDRVTFKVLPKGDVVVSYPEGLSIELKYEQDQGGIALLSKSISIDGTVLFKNAIKNRETFIKTPLAKGDCWTYGQFEAKNEGEEEILVPLGTFPCFRLLYLNKNPTPIGKCNIIGNPNSITLWVSGGTGIVKQSWTTEWGYGKSGGTITQSRELLQFTKAAAGYK